jgi:hypothetical protein
MLLLPFSESNQECFRVSSVCLGVLQQLRAIWWTTWTGGSHSLAGKAARRGCAGCRRSRHRWLSGHSCWTLHSTTSRRPPWNTAQPRRSPRALSRAYSHGAPRNDRVYGADCNDVCGGHENCGHAADCVEILLFVLNGGLFTYGKSMLGAEMDDCCAGLKLRSDAFCFKRTCLQAIVWFVGARDVLD